MVDQRALEAACREFKEHLYIAGKLRLGERIAIEAAIEAYEAAKWRPIEECEHDTGNWFLVHKDHRMRGSFDLMFWDQTHEWCVVGGDRTYTNDDLIGRRAMFRTIDPPTQDADCSEPQPTKNERG